MSAANQVGHTPVELVGGFGQKADRQLGVGRVQFLVRRERQVGQLIGDGGAVGVLAAKHEILAVCLAPGARVVLDPEEFDQLFGLLASESSRVDIGPVIGVQGAVEVPHGTHEFPFHLDHLVHEPGELQGLMEGLGAVGGYLPADLGYCAQARFVLGIFDDHFLGQIGEALGEPDGRLVDEFDGLEKGALLPGNSGLLAVPTRVLDEPRQASGEHILPAG